MDPAVPPWLEEQLPAALQLATLLTGSSAQATGLVALALERLPRRLFHDLEPDDEVSWAQVRAAVVQAYLGLRGHVIQPDPGPLDQLSQLDRAAVLLRVVELLTVAEIAAVLDRSPATTATVLDTALARLGLDREGRPGGPAGLVSRAAITTLAAQTPDPAGVTRSLRHSQAHRDHRLRLGMVGVAAVAAVGVLAVLVPLAVLPWWPAPSRNGEWVLIHRVEAPSGWVSVDRTIAPTYEESTLRSTEPRSQARCVVHLDLAGVAPPSEQESVRRSSARIRGKRGYFEFGDPPLITPYLAWQYTPGAWAQVSCTPAAPLDRALLAAIANGVRFEKTPLKLPFAIEALPADYRILSATETLDFPSGEVVLAKDDLQPGDANLSLSYAHGTTVTDMGSIRILHLRRGLGYYDTNPGHPRLCLDQPGRQYVCISGYWPLGEWPALAPLPINIAPTIIGVAESMTIATDLGNRSTWPPATKALPRS